MEDSISVNDLACAMKESLERMGKLDSIRASLRSQVFQCLQSSLQIKQQQEQQTQQSSFDSNKHETKLESRHDLIMVDAPIEFDLCQYLIVDYLKCCGFQHTLSTFKAESGDTRMNNRTHDSAKLATSEQIMRRIIQDLERVNHRRNKENLQLEEENVEEDTSNSMNLPTLFSIIKHLNVVE